MIKESNVTIMVLNINDSIKFYTEILGFNLKYNANDEWAEIEAPSLTIGLHKKDAHSTNVKIGDNMSIGFSVDDLDKAIIYFEKKGLKISRYEIDVVRLGFFKDLDGNQLYLVEEKH